MESGRLVMASTCSAPNPPLRMAGVLYMAGREALPRDDVRKSRRFQVRCLSGRNRRIDRLPATQNPADPLVRGLSAGTHFTGSWMPSDEMYPAAVACRAWPESAAKELSWSRGALTTSVKPPGQRSADGNRKRNHNKNANEEGKERRSRVDERLRYLLPVSFQEIAQFARTLIWP
nr:hypothetical protein CFP56_03879 [Quercus suber]